MGQCHCQLPSGEVVETVQTRQIDKYTGLDKIQRKPGRQTYKERTDRRLGTYKGKPIAQPQTLRRSAIVDPRKRFCEEYVWLDTPALGQGMSGDVRLARCISSGGVVAVKMLDKTGLSQRQQHSLIREVDIHSSLDHANIVRLLQVFHEPDAIYLVLEYCSGGTLAAKLKEKGRFDEIEAAAVIHQVLSAVVYCHGHRVVHRDLKPENFVYDRPGEGAVLKLLDFGLSAVLPPGSTHLSKPVGTTEYMAPECISDEKHNQACDLWSIGVITSFLLSGSLPFSGTNDEEVATAILDTKHQMDSGVWQEISESAKDFVRVLLSDHPPNRPSAETAILKPWIAKVSPISDVDYVPLSMDFLSSIEAYASSSAMRRAAAAIAVYSSINLNGEDVKLAESQFQSLDADGNGTISRKELTEVLQQELGISTQRCTWVFDQLDLDGDLEIHRSEFLAAVVGARLLKSDAEVEKAFKCFDKSKAGRIYQKDLSAILGEKFCGRPTKQIFAELDTNADRMIDFNEFSAMVDTYTDDVSHAHAERACNNDVSLTSV